MIHEVTHEVQQLPQKRWFVRCIIISSLVLHYTDLGTDINVMYNWYTDDPPHYWWFGLAVTFTVIPGIVLGFVVPTEDKHPWRVALINVLHMAPLYSAVPSWKAASVNVVPRIGHRFSTNKFVVGILDSYPESVLQMYVALHLLTQPLGADGEPPDRLQYLSLTLSFFSTVFTVFTARISSIRAVPLEFPVDGLPVKILVFLGTLFELAA